MPERNREKHVQFHSLFRATLFFCALAGAALLGGWLFVKNQVHDQIRREFERKFAERYVNMHVTVRSARFIESHGIEIRGISIANRIDGSLLAHVDELFVACPIDTAQLLAEQQVKARRLRIRGLTVWAERSADGAWNVARLWPLPKFGDKLPPTNIENATVVISDLSRQPPGTTSLREINLSIIGDHRLSIRDGDATPRSVTTYQVDGHLAADYCDRISFQAKLEPDSEVWQVGGNVKGVAFSRQLIRELPHPWPAKLAAIDGVAGQVDLSFSVGGPTFDPADMAFVVRGTIKNGHVADPRLPYRFHDLSADFYVDNRRLRVTDLSAQNGLSRVELTLDRFGMADNSPMRVNAKLQQIAIDRRVAAGLPSELRELWNKLAPVGRVDADVQLSFDGRRWQPEFDVRCSDVSFVYYKFPFRLEQTNGLISLRGSELTLHLEASAAGQPVVVQGQLQQVGAANLGWIDIVCERPIPIDERLIRAIVDEKVNRVVRSLNPGGALTLHGRFERTSAEQEDFRKHVTLRFQDSSINYVKFPYSLTKIRGTMLWTDRGLQFEDFTARNGSGYIECSGYWQPIDADNNRLVLELTGTDIPLENELRDAMNAGARKIWSDLQPRGTLDHLKVDINYLSAQSKLSVGVKAQKWKKDADGGGHSVTMKPVWFPYRMDEVTGTVEFRDGAIKLTKVSATHGDTRLAIQGGCRLEPDGSWQADLDKLTVDELRVNRSLLDALPKPLGDAVSKLNPQGPVNVSGGMRFARSGNADASPLTAGWDLKLDVENGSVACGLPLNHIHGQLRLTGGYDGRSFQSRGELNLDSVMHKDVQLTQVRGPLLIESTGVIIGAEAERGRTDRPPRSLEAQVFDGKLSLDAVVKSGGDRPFVLQARVEKADLRQFSYEMAHRSGKIAGKANAGLQLRGNAQGPHSWDGNGWVRLYDADIYEVPVMLQLLKLLSVSRPDKTAFTSSDINYRIHGDHVYLDRINFNGDAISLRGHGEVDFRGQFSSSNSRKPQPEVNMQFYTLVGRDNLRIPGISDLLSRASQQLLLIHVRGTLDDPRLTKEPLPVLKETLEQIFPETAANAAANRSR